MVTIYDLKPRFQALLRPACRALAARGVTANQVTVAALALSVACGLALACWPGARGPLLALPVVLLVRMALNAIDGMLAREHGQASAVGAVVNELGDVVSDLAITLPFAWIPGFSAPLVVVLVLVALLTEMAGVVAVQVGASRRYDGPFGKSDRAAFFGLLALLLGLGVAAGWWLDAALGVAALLAAVTVARRVTGALREIGEGA